jgi:hypothetical protein
MELEKVDTDVAGHGYYMAETIYILIAPERKLE